MYRISKDARKAEMMCIADSKHTHFSVSLLPCKLVHISNSLTMIQFIKIGSAKRGADLVTLSGYTFLIARASNLSLFDVYYTAGTPVLEMLAAVSNAANDDRLSLQCSNNIHSV